MFPSVALNDGLYMTEICSICKKPAIRFEQTLSRWFDENNKEMVAHSECDLAVNSTVGCCPQCKSKAGVKIPRDSSPYCEDCGWPDEDFDV